LVLFLAIYKVGVTGRMANVLDVVMETTKALSPAPTKKIAEAAKAQAEAETGQAEAEATKT
jgi:hypothetical protein